MTFQNFPIWLNLLIFLAAAVAIWYAGSHLERYTDAISRRTQLGKAFLGLLLLSTATGLPEIATTTSAILTGNRELALYNLFGSIVIQTAILAGVDILVSEGPLTRFTPNFAVLMEGMGLILVIAAAVVGISLDAGLSSSFDLSGSLLPIGLGPLLAFAAYLVVVFLSQRAEAQARWVPAKLDSESQKSEQEGNEDHGPEKKEASAGKPETGENAVDEQVRKLKEQPWAQLLLALAAFSLIVLVGGWTVAMAGDALAQQTGLGASFFGFTLLSVATSLPEISTTTSAVRNGNYSLAYSNIFGSNAFDVALLLPAALIYQSVLLKELPDSIIFAAALGILMTSIFIWGLLERRNWTVLRMGWDSFSVLILCLLGITGLYFLR